VTAHEPDPSGFSDSQRSGIERRRADQDRTLQAVHVLEQALGAAAPRREAQWRRDVLTALVTLDEAVGEEARNAARPDSLLSDVSHTQPLLRNRVRGLRAQFRQVREQIQELRRELALPDDEDMDFADIRHRLSWVLTALRHLRARESDLIYEAYYDAFHVDLGYEARAPEADAGAAGDDPSATEPPNGRDS